MATTALKIEPLSLDSALSNTTSQNGDGTESFSILNLISGIELLKNDFEGVEGQGAPKEVDDIRVDVEFLGESVGYLGVLFGDDVGREGGREGRVRISGAGVQALKTITLPLSKTLSTLHQTLQKFPKPPAMYASLSLPNPPPPPRSPSTISTLSTPSSSTEPKLYIRSLKRLRNIWSVVSFNLQHTSEVTLARKEIIDAQLQLTVFLSEATFLPELTLAEPRSPVRKVDVEMVPEREWRRRNSSEGVEIEHLEDGGRWGQLRGLLGGLGCSLRLRDLVEKLGEIEKVAGEAGEEMSGFRSDILGVWEVCKGLDGRLVGEKGDLGVAVEVRRELHTVIDLEVKMLLHELHLIAQLMLSKGLFLPPSPLSSSPSSSSPSLSYTSIPLHDFLLDHKAILMMIQTLVAGSRNSKSDPRHQGGTLRHEAFDEAGAAVLGRLAMHSGGVNSWCEVERHGL